MLTAAFALLLGLPAQAPGQPTTGTWFYRDFFDKTKLKSPWRANQMQIPAIINQGESDAFSIDPGIRAKLQKVMNAFQAASPKPTFAHHMFHITQQGNDPGLKLKNSVAVSIGDFVFKYDDKGILQREKTPFDGFNYHGLGALFFNKAIDDSLDGFFRVFPEIDTLKYTDATRRTEHAGPKYRAIPPAFSGTHDLNEIKRVSAQFDPTTVVVEPKRMSASVAKFGSYRTRYAGGEPTSCESQLRLLWTHNGKLPFTDYVTRGKLIDLIESYSKSLAEFEKKLGEERAATRDEKYRKGDLAYVERAYNLNLRLVATARLLREHYQSSLNEVAIVDPNYWNQVLNLTMRDMSDEIHAAKANRPKEFKFPIEKMFLSDPALGYRIAKFDRQFFAGLKPGEVRLVYAKFNLWQRYPHHPDYKKVADKWVTHGAEVPGTIRHALLNTFDWGVINSVLGP